MRQKFNPKSEAFRAVNLKRQLNFEPHRAGAMPAPFMGIKLPVS